LTAFHINWLERATELVAVNSKIITFCKSSTEKWNTTLQLKAKQEAMQSKPIKICRIIFHMDSFLTITLLRSTYPFNTHTLNRAHFGYQVHRAERKISHLLHMDDVKLLGSSEEDFES
jgi:hypothetical protein